MRWRYEAAHFVGCVAVSQAPALRNVLSYTRHTRSLLRAPGPDGSVATHHPPPPIRVWVHKGHAAQEKDANMPPLPLLPAHSRFRAFQPARYQKDPEACYLLPLGWALLRYPLSFSR